MHWLPVSRGKAYFRGPHRRNGNRGRSRDEIQKAFVETGDDPVRFYLAPLYLDTKLEAKLSELASGTWRSACWITT